jgi:hypothetical protein
MLILWRINKLQFGNLQCTDAAKNNIIASVMIMILIENLIDINNLCGALGSILWNIAPKLEHACLASIQWHFRFRRELNKRLLLAGLTTKQYDNQPKQ